MEEKTQELSNKRDKPIVNKKSINEYDLTREYYDKTPSVLIQSALFGISKKREKVTAHKIPTIGDLEITFNGELFSQFDFDVFQALVELAHEKSNTDFSFKLIEIIKILGKKNESENKESIHKSIHRLATSRFTITSKKSKFSGGLVDSYTEDKEDSSIQHVRISKETFNLFIFSSSYDKEVRNNLKGNLAKFYYMFFCSHQSFIYNYKLETYHILSDSESKLNEFKRVSKKAFDEINMKTRFSSEIEKNKNNEDIVVVKKR